MATKKAKASEKKTQKAIRDQGKTQLVLDMVAQGSTRKAILDELVKMNPEISRKSNAGLVSHIFKRNSLKNIPSGVSKGASKKLVKVKAKAKTTGKSKTKVPAKTKVEAAPAEAEVTA